MAVRNRGAVLLSRVQATQDEIGTAMGVVRETISRWQGGAKIPRDGHRALLEDRYGIPSASWTEEHVSEPGSGPHLTARAGGATMAEKVAVLSQTIDTMIAAANNPDLSELSRVRMLPVLLGVLERMGRLTGETDPGATIFKLPQWRRLKAELLEALGSHPAGVPALDVVAEVLNRIERGE